MYQQLVEHLRQHFHPDESVGPHDAWDFMHQFGNGVDVLLYVTLFCPQFVADCWRGRLALLYPSRKFQVSVVPPSEDGMLTFVEFFEVR